MCSPKFHRYGISVLLVACMLYINSCYSYRIATHAQPATDASPVNSMKTYSLFWGLLNKPQVISTPVCDSLGAYGVSEVQFKTNFGNAVLTVCTLGIYCPARLEWKCAKPCPQVDSL
jgi:hypothetical protein